MVLLSLHKNQDCHSYAGMADAMLKANPVLLKSK